MLDDVREILCRKWALDVLRFLVEEGTQNYSDIEDEFETSSDVVTERLQQLSSVGLINRNEKSARDVRYSITDEGEEVVQHVGEVYQLLDE